MVWGNTCPENCILLKQIVLMSFQALFITGMSIVTTTSDSRCHVCMYGHTWHMHVLPCTPHTHIHVAVTGRKRTLAQGNL